MILGMSRAFMDGLGVGPPLPPAAQFAQDVNTALMRQARSGKPLSFTSIDEITQRIGLDDELLPGLKNKFLYGGLAALYLGYRMLKKKKK